MHKPDYEDTTNPKYADETLWTQMDCTTAWGWRGKRTFNKKRKEYPADVFPPVLLVGSRNKRVRAGHARRFFDEVLSRPDGGSEPQPQAEPEPINVGAQDENPPQQKRRIGRPVGLPRKTMISALALPMVVAAGAAFGHHDHEVEVEEVAVVMIQAPS
jgi:hypothetical protein